MVVERRRRRRRRQDFVRLLWPTVTKLRAASRQATGNNDNNSDAEQLDWHLHVRPLWPGRSLEADVWSWAAVRGLHSAPSPPQPPLLQLSQCRERHFINPESLPTSQVCRAGPRDFWAAAAAAEIRLAPLKFEFRAQSDRRTATTTTTDRVAIRMIGSGVVCQH